MSVRRLVLDPILMQAAVEAGAEVRMAAKVTALVRDRDRVTGVRVARNGSEQALGARLVVGADGRNSTVARLAGSRKYNLTPNERFTYWSFFEGADPGAEPRLIFHRWSGNLVFAMPSDSGLYQVLALPSSASCRGSGAASRKATWSTSGAATRWLTHCRTHAGSASCSGRSTGRGSSARPRARAGSSSATPAISRTRLQARAFRTRSGRPSSWRGDPRRHRQVAIGAGRGAGGLGALARRRRRRALLARDRPRQGGPGACGAAGDRAAFVRPGQAGLVPGPVQPPFRPLAGADAATAPSATARLLPRRGCDRRAMWARWAPSSPRTPGGNAWPGIRIMSPSERPKTRGRPRPKTTMPGDLRRASPPLGLSPRRPIPGADGGAAGRHGGGRLCARQSRPADDWRDLLSAQANSAGRLHQTCPATAVPACRRTSATRWTATPTTWRRCSISSASPARISSRTTSAARGRRVGRTPSRRPGQRHAHQHRRADRLPVAPLRPDLEDAHSWGGLPGHDQPPGVPDAARPREPAADARSGRSHLRRCPFLGHQARVLKLYRATPAATLADPAEALRPLDRPALVIWGTEDAYLPYEQAERQRQAFPSAHVEISPAMATGSCRDPERVASLVIPFLRQQLPDPARA